MSEIQINARYIKENLNDEIIKNIMEEYEAFPNSETSDYIIFPTICHNINPEEASYKLYYYKSSKIFYCFTECSKSYDIFELFITIEHLRGNSTYTFFDALYYLQKKLNIEDSFLDFNNEKAYTSKREYWQKKNRKLPYNIYKDVMNFFNFYLPYEWAKDGITLNELKTYNVRYYPTENQMVIPHYSADKQLVGVRIRAFNEEDIQKGKYRPLRLENTVYSHPLSQFCYGLWKTKYDIKKTQKAIIFEAEKSVMLAEQLEYNNTIACCGSNISKVQIEQLIQNGAKEIIIAFDRDYTTNNKSEQYYNKIYHIANKYKLYCNMSFIFDFENILGYKHSPIDDGIEKFNYLFNKRIKV